VAAAWVSISLAHSLLPHLTTARVASLRTVWLPLPPLCSPLRHVWAHTFTPHNTITSPPHLTRESRPFVTPPLVASLHACTINQRAICSEMSVPIRKSAGAGSRRRIKYTEQPFPEPELAKRLVNEQLQSPLFKIPKELRNRIFDLAFQNSDNTIDISALFYREESDTPNSIHDAAAPPSTSLILTWSVMDERTRDMIVTCC
jgi:hypothetical protein